MPAWSPLNLAPTAVPAQGTCPMKAGETTVKDPCLGYAVTHVPHL